MGVDPVAQAHKLPGIRLPSLNISPDIILTFLISD